MEWFCSKCRTVVHTNKFTCCGEVELFDPAKHGHDLISLSNSWISVLARWKDDPILKEVSNEYCEDGCYSAATIMNGFIAKLRAEFYTSREDKK